MSIYDEIEIEDMTFDSTLQIYHYPCPCGDKFEISIADLRDGEDIAVCPSCSLMIKVIYEVDDLPKPEGEGGTQPSAITRAVSMPAEVPDYAGLPSKQAWWDDPKFPLSP